MATSAVFCIIANRQPIVNILLKLYTSIELRNTPDMKSNMNTILGFVEIGTAGEMYFKRKVRPQRGTRSSTKKYFVVKGIIRKPGGFISKDALVMEVHEMGKK